MTPQEAVEAQNVISYQMRNSFGGHEAYPGRMLMSEGTPPYVRTQLARMDYSLEFTQRSNGPINAILLDREHGTLWGGSSHNGKDYGIAW